MTHPYGTFIIQYNSPTERFSSSTDLLLQVQDCTSHFRPSTVK